MGACADDMSKGAYIGTCPLKNYGDIYWSRVALIFYEIL